MKEKNKEPLFHIVKRDALPWYKALGIRFLAILLALILCGIWLVRGPRAKKAAPEAAPEENDFQEYQPEKKMPSLLDRFARKAEPDTTGEVTLDPEDEDDGREE